MNRKDTNGIRKCYICGRTNHTARDCRSPKTESSGSWDRPKKPSNAKVVQSGDSQNGSQLPLQVLYSDSDEGEDGDVRMVHIRDARVEIQGVPAYGFVDIGADMSIIGGNLFKKVATVACLTKRDFKPTDKTPRNNDGGTFSLDGRMDLEVTFNGKSIITTVYIRIDAEDQLLLSEGVCRQLGIVNYDPLVEVWRGGRQTRAKNQERQSTKVPTVRVRLLQTTHLLPQQSVLTREEVIGSALPDDDATLLVEPSKQVTEKPGVVLEPTITRMSKDNTVPLVVTNILGFTHKLDKGMTVGDVSFISEVIEEDSIADSHTIVNQIDSAEGEKPPQKEALLKIMENETKNLPTGVTERFTSFLADNNEAFALSDSV